MSGEIPLASLPQSLSPPASANSLVAILSNLIEAPHKSLLPPNQTNALRSQTDAHAALFDRLQRIKRVGELQRASPQPYPSDQQYIDRASANGIFGVGPKYVDPTLMRAIQERLDSFGSTPLNRGNDQTPNPYGSGYWDRNT